MREAVSACLGKSESLQLIDPLRYTDFVYLLARAWTVVTDSGGIQEEAPSFGIPVVITREATERPEVVEAGFGHLVGSDLERIVGTVRELTKGVRPTRIRAPSPFGDGQAARRIASILLKDKSLQSERLPAPAIPLLVDGPQAGAV